MIILDTVNKKLVLTVNTADANGIVFTGSYVDITIASGLTAASAVDGAVTTATTADIITQPAASTSRQIKQLAFHNQATTASITITVQLNNTGTLRPITHDVVLSAGETLYYDSDGGWSVKDAQMRSKTTLAASGINTGTVFDWYKVGTSPEAAGISYSFSKDAGFPGAWAPGTPGLAGRATDGTTAADAGSFALTNPASGANYLTSYTAANSVVGTSFLHDILWVNSGLVVTTTTAQTINSVAWPARDRQGTTNGDAVTVGILVTASTTNAANVTNCTMSYTNSAGTAGRTATMASFPLTANVGTLVWFQLAAGDTGVRSIQTITLGTSLVTGSISLIAVRQITSIGTLAASVAQSARIDPGSGVRLYNGACLLLYNLPSSVAAVTTQGNMIVTTR